MRSVALESIPKEKKEAIARDYLDLSIKANEIPKKYHISPATLKKIREEYSIPLRTAEGRAASVQGEPKTGVCSNCGCGINPIGAKFCCICGKPILTPKETLIKRVQELTKYFQLASAGTRDAFIADLNKIVEGIKKLEVRE